MTAFLSEYFLGYACILPSEYHPVNSLVNELDEVQIDNFLTHDIIEVYLAGINRNGGNNPWKKKKYHRLW